MVAIITIDCIIDNNNTGKASISLILTLPLPWTVFHLLVIYNTDTERILLSDPHYSVISGMDSSPVIYYHLPKPICIIVSQIT